MTENIRIMDPFAEPFAVDGIPAARPLTKDDLKKIQGALKEFEKALAGWDHRRDEEAQKAAPEPTKEKSTRHILAVRHNSVPMTRPHCLILSGYLGESYGSQLERSTEEAVAEACARHFGANSASAPGGYPVEPLPERIHVILHSRGGSLDSAYKVVLFLRSFAKDVRVYVPRRAKSAATLIAVGADQVVMSPFAELGPLDTQITDPRNPATHVSALDCYRSVDYVREFGVLAIPRALKVMLDQTQALIPLGELIESATTFATGSASPMLEQVKALDFGAWGRTLKIGENYAQEVRRRLSHPDSEEDAERIAWKLVYGYTHHLYPIDRAEAKRLGLAVDTMPYEVYKAAGAIAAACKGESRFVGFSEDVADAISKWAEPKDGAVRSALGPVARAKAARSAQAYGRVSSHKGPVSSYRGPVSPQ